MMALRLFSVVVCLLFPLYALADEPPVAQVDSNPPIAQVVIVQTSTIAYPPGSIKLDSGKWVKPDGKGGYEYIEKGGEVVVSTTPFSNTPAVIVLPSTRAINVPIVERPNTISPGITGMGHIITPVRTAVQRGNTDCTTSE